MGLIEILLPDALINQPLVNSKFLVEGTSAGHLCLAEQVLKTLLMNTVAGF